VCRSSANRQTPCRDDVFDLKANPARGDEGVGFRDFYRESLIAKDLRARLAFGALRDRASSCINEFSASPDTNFGTTSLEAGVTRFKIGWSDWQKRVDP